VSSGNPLSQNAVIRSYAWDTSGRQLYVKSGTNVWYEITDPHSDVASLAAGTALAGTEHFDAWGNQVASSGSTIPFGYQGSLGSWTDTTTGLVSMGVRWYYPRVGLFTSSDPAVGTANPSTPIDRTRWTYVDNSPIDRVDPMGLFGLACEDLSNPDCIIRTQPTHASSAPPAPSSSQPLCDRNSCNPTSTPVQAIILPVLENATSQSSSDYYVRSHMTATDQSRARNLAQWCKPDELALCDRHPCTLLPYLCSPQLADSQEWPDQLTGGLPDQQLPRFGSCNLGTIRVVCPYQTVPSLQLRLNIKLGSQSDQGWGDAVAAPLTRSNNAGQFLAVLIAMAAAVSVLEMSKGGRHKQPWDDMPIKGQTGPPIYDFWDPSHFGGGMMGPGGGPWAKKIAVALIGVMTFIWGGEFLSTPQYGSNATPSPPPTPKPSPSPKTGRTTLYI
jgi:RHS repeat-associated protein